MIEGGGERDAGGGFLGLKMNGKKKERKRREKETRDKERKKKKRGRRKRCRKKKERKGRRKKEKKGKSKRKGEGILLFFLFLSLLLSDPFPTLSSFLLDLAKEEERRGGNSKLPAAERGEREREREKEAADRKKNWRGERGPPSSSPLWL